MRQISIGDVTITSIVERDGPWRSPEAMFPAFDPVIGHRHLAEMEPLVYDAASGRLVASATGLCRAALASRILVPPIVIL